VIPTRPAKEAFRHMETSGAPFLIHVNIIQTKVATAGAIVVVPRICANCVGSDAAAPLNPYHANHKIKHPSAPSVRECPGNAFTTVFPSFPFVYLPIRGPSIAAPITEAIPPTI